MEVEVNEDLIATIMGLLTVGQKFFKDKKRNEEAMVQFFKDDERKQLIKLESWGYERTSLKKIWVSVSEVLMHYVTLEGRFRAILGHHFTLLNHLDMVCSYRFLFSYYLLWRS